MTGNLKKIQWKREVRGCPTDSELRMTTRHEEQTFQIRLGQKNHEEDFLRNMQSHVSERFDRIYTTSNNFGVHLVVNA